MTPPYVIKIIRDIENIEDDGANIGILVAKAFLIYAENFEGFFPEEFSEGIEEILRMLEKIRPSCVSVSNAIRYILKRMHGKDVSTLRESVMRASQEFIENAERAIESIGKICAERISNNATIMTHGNHKATISAIINAHRAGKNIEVIVTETRPRLEGYRLIRELEVYDIPVTLIVDSAMRYFMKEVDIVIVGADIVASNGAVISKIGTSTMALCAYEARVPFIVCSETYRFSPETVIGRLIQIEERNPEEIVDPSKFKRINIRNPAFDATPPEYVDAIITEKGVISPYLAYEIIKEEFGVNL